MAANPEVLAYVIEAARKRGIDPAVAVKAFNHEGLLVFDPNKPDLGGDDRSSFGPFQLHYGGRSRKMPNAGMGDDFTAKTGLDASDPSTWRAQTDFVMDYLAKGGTWAPWMGAAAEGITGRAGLPGGTAAPRISGPVEAAGAGFGNEAAKDAPQLTTPPAPAVATAEPTPAEVTGDALGEIAAASYNPFGSLGATLASAIGKDKSQLQSAPMSAPIQAAPVARNIEVPLPPVAPDASPPMDLASLFKVAPAGQVPQVDSVTGRPVMRRQYG